MCLSYEKMEEFLELFSKLKNDLKKLETELLQLSSKNFIIDNRELEEKVEKIQKENSDLKEKTKKLEEEKSKLETTLVTSAYTERVAILNNEIKKIKNVMGYKIDGEIEKIELIKKEIAIEIDKVQKKIQQERVVLKEELFRNLENFKKKNEKILINERERIKAEEKALLDNQIGKLEDLKKQEFSKEQLSGFFNRNNFERLIGLNLINKLGILMILIGVVVLSKYSVALISDLMKGVIIFLIGGGMFVTGELLSKKNKATIFSIGMLAGGIGVIYAGIALSFFILNILSVEISIILYILLGILGVLLSLKHNSQVILNFALVGGYLPLILIKNNDLELKYLYLFFAGFSMLSLFVSFKKKWIFANYLGLALNIVTSLVLGAVLGLTKGSMLDYIFALLYVIYSFIVYSLIPIVSNYKLKERFMKLDVVLVSINTFFGAIFTYAIFYLADWKDFYGLLAIIFAVLYVVFAKAIEKKFSVAENIIMLFYLTGLTFVALIVPLQFGKIWLSLGWLIEGVILLKFGVLSGKKEFEKFGIILSSLSIISFLIVDVLLLQTTAHLFLLKYSASTFGVGYITWLYLNRKESLTQPVKILKIVAVINIVIYLKYLLIFDVTLLKLFGKNSYQLRSYFELLWIASIYFIACFINSNPKIKDKNMKNISTLIYAVGLLNVTYLIVFGDISYMTESIILTSLKVIIGIWLAILMLSKIFKNINFNTNYCPVVIAGYLVLMITRGVVFYLEIEFFSLFITLFIFGCSILMIGVGFVKSYYHLRRVGLILILLGIIKLFIFDFIILTTTNKIISYFALGIALILTSYIYQYFDKKFVLDMKEGSK